jgi:hypothetical protein
MLSVVGEWRTVALPGCGRSREAPGSDWTLKRTRARSGTVGAGDGNRTRTVSLGTVRTAQGRMPVLVLWVSGLSWGGRDCPWLMARQWPKRWALWRQAPAFSPGSQVAVVAIVADNANKGRWEDSYGAYCVARVASDSG